MLFGKASEMSKIIKHSEHFHEDFLPDKIIARKEKIREINQKIIPDSFIHLHIYGKSGTGKTSTVRKILGRKPDSLYINCWNKSTKHKILEEILIQMGIGVTPKEATSDLIKRFNNTKKRIICLDEIEKLKQTDVLVTIAQHCECLILISNDKDCLDKIDSKTKSRLPLDEIEFKKYSDSEIQQILTNCVSGGLFTNSVNNSTLSLISKLSSGDIRVAIQTLAIASRYAEWNKKKQITINEIHRAIKSTNKQNVSNTLKLLNSDQRLLYNIIKENESISTGDLFKEYKLHSTNPIQESCYRKYMRILVDFDLVKTLNSDRWKKFSLR